MPIFKAANKLVYFAHVPKCAGTAVERYLELRFGNLAFLQPRHDEIPPDLRWSRTSPQHVNAASLMRLFPQSFFDASFAVVRHPVDRLVSEYHFRRDRKQQIPPDLGFSDWVKQIPERLARTPWAYDNHLRPMSDLLPNGTVWFQLEQGLESVVYYLDNLVGERKGPRKIEPALRRDPAIEPVKPTDRDREMIGQIYERDFRIFRYLS